MVEQVGTNRNFDLPVDEILDLAIEGVGGEHVSFEEARKIRTALNLVLIDLQNRGMAPLASVQLTETTLVSGSSENYQLSSATFNIMDAVVNISSSSESTDLPIERLSYSEWLDLPTKSTKGRPTHYLVDRQRNNIQVSLWPVPDNNTYKFKAWTLQRIANVDKSYQLVDVPHRYLPAIISGLRFHLSILRSRPLDERQWLKMEYLEVLQRALDEDRERTDFDVYPANKPQL